MLKKKKSTSAVSCLHPETKNKLETQALQLGSCDCLRKLVPVTEATLPDASLLTLVRGPFPWFKALRRKDCLWQETTSINAVQLLHKYKYHYIAMLYLLFHVFPAKTCELFVHEEHPAPSVRCLLQAEDQTLTHTHLRIC